MITLALRNGLEHLLPPQFDDQVGGAGQLLSGGLPAFTTGKGASDEANLSSERLSFFRCGGELTLCFVQARLQLGLCEEDQRVPSSDQK